MLIKLELEGPEGLHDAHCDAVATMQICRELCRRHRWPLSELLLIKEEPKPKKQKHKPVACTGTTVGEEIAARGDDLTALLSLCKD